MTAPRFPVGTVIDLVDASKYTDADGNPAVHTIRQRAVITATDEVGFAYTMTDIISETGAPTHFAPRRFTSGQTAWFAVDHHIATGRIISPNT